jgi:hypothetical protein
LSVKANACKMWSRCITMYQYVFWREWPCTYGVCNRSLGCIDILNALLHIPQVYVYKHLTQVTNLLLWLICFLWLPSFPNHSNGASVGPTFEICVAAKYSYQFWEIKGYWYLMVSEA